MPREPIEIPIKHGETAKRRVVVDGASVVLEFSQGSTTNRGGTLPIGAARGSHFIELAEADAIADEMEQREKFDAACQVIDAELRRGWSEIRGLKQQLAACREELGKSREGVKFQALLVTKAEAERDYLAKRLREVQVELGKVLGAEAALEPTTKSDGAGGES